jgi:hypothetical protein
MLEINWAPIVGAFVITKKSWDQMSPEVQSVLRASADSAGAVIRTQARKEVEEAVDAMKKRGLQVNKPNAEQLKEWRTLSESLYPRIRGKMVPADTFDNVKGKFPIGFSIWDTKEKERFESFKADVYEKHEQFVGVKSIYSYDNTKFINDWLRPTWKNTKETIGFLACNSNDFGNQNGIFIELNKKNSTSTYFKPITKDNLTMSSIYYAVRHCIEASWLNDRDQFLFPNNGWVTDVEFQNDSLAFTLFSNDIQSKAGINHWIPFTEIEVNSKEKFESNFMSDFIKGKLKSEQQADGLFGDTTTNHFDINKPRQFSIEATAVFNAGLELWKHYHSQDNVNVNASLYDIKLHFQGRNDKGRMNAKSTDEKYTELMGNLRQKLNLLSDKIAPKVYEHEFLTR